MEALLDAYGDIDLVRCYLHAPTNVGAFTSLQLRCATFDLSFAVEKLEYVRGHASMTPEYHELLHSCELAVETCSEKLSRVKALAYEDIVASARSRKRKVDDSFDASSPQPSIEGLNLQDLCVQFPFGCEGYIAGYDASTKQYKVVKDRYDMVEYFDMSEFNLVTPRKKDLIRVVKGELSPSDGALIGIDGDDRIVKIGEDIRILHASCIAKIRDLPKIL